MRLIILAMIVCSLSACAVAPQKQNPNMGITMKMDTVTLIPNK